MSVFKNLKDAFNQQPKILQGAEYGFAGAFVAAAALPVITVSAPVLAAGAAIGAYFGYKNS